MPVEPLQGTKWLPILEQHDFPAIASLTKQARSPLEVYLGVRAALVLGDNDEAARLAKRWADRLSSCPELNAFIAAQLSLFLERNPSQALASLSPLCESLKAHDYLGAEYHFIVGLAHNVQDQFKKAIRHHERAAKAYADLGFAPSEGMALFNLCVAYDHLGERELFDHALLRLEILFARSPEGSLAAANLSHLFHRMQANRLIDAEEYEAALDCAGIAYRMCQRLKRWRDVGGLSVIMAYLYLKLGRSREFHELMTELGAFEAHLTRYHQTVIKELAALAELSFPTARDVNAKLKKWRALAIDSVHFLLLFDLVLASIEQSRDYPLLAKLARQAAKLSLSRQQALTVIDFRYYEALGLLKSGLTSRGQALAQAYTSDARLGGSARRQEKADHLASVVVSLADQVAPRATGPRLVLDVSQRTLALDGRSIDLTKKPSVEKLLECLMTSEGPVALGTAYAAVYEAPYHSLHHDRQLHSLIGRARRMLGDARLIVRRDGRLGFSPDVTCEVRHGDALRLPALRRRERLLAHLREAGSALTIRDLEPHFEQSRRTLELDLKYLSRLGLVSTLGSTRGRRYQTTGDRHA